MKKLLKGILFLGTASVTMPFVISVCLSFVRGWPKRKNRMRRALNPLKILALHRSLLQKFYITMRYARLWVDWNVFYKSTGHDILRKNFAFGRNEKTLDLYLPPGVDLSKPRPVVIFVYGGAWSYGDKSMYGMLCHGLSSKLGALVCCPNYSYYPMGFVDDMIQDVVDCIDWVYNSIEDYGGNKDKIMLIGHSAGAHLCAMAILELLHEQLILGGSSEPQFDFPSNIHFEESHYEAPGDTRSRTDTCDESSGSSGSFTVLNENGEKVSSLNSNTISASFEVVSKTDGASLDVTEKEKQRLEESAWTEIGSGDIKESGKDIVEENKEQGDRDEKKEQKDGNEGVKLKKESNEQTLEVKESEDEDEDDDSIVTVKQKDLHSQPSLLELGKSIKAFIGLAGVYDIGNHFIHESTRGIEDISCMERAMYGEDCFNRFSPAQVVKSLPVGIMLPHMELLHGTKDYVVPISSTTEFAEALKQRCRNVGIRIIQECDHYEICLDLMDSNRKFYEPVMDNILQVAHRTLY